VIDNESRDGRRKRKGYSNQSEDNRTGGPGTGHTQGDVLRNQILNRKKGCSGRRAQKRREGTQLSEMGAIVGFDIPDLELIARSADREIRPKDQDARQVRTI